MPNTEWDTLFINTRLATMVEHTSPYGATDADCLAIQNGRIAWIGTQDALPSFTRPSHCVEIDMEGRWMTPGLIDCHTHMVYGGNRAEEFEMALNGASYEEIAKKGGGIISTVNSTRRASEDDLLAASQSRLKESLRYGVTTLEIKSGYGLDLENEIKMLEVAKKLGEQNPVRVRKTFLGAHALPPEFAGDSDGYMDKVCKEMLPTIHALGLVDAVDAFCEKIAFSTEQVRSLFKAAEALKVPVKLHAEQLSNLQGAELAAHFKALSADHLEYLDERGVKAMADHGTVAVLLPGAFYFLRETKLPPLELLREHKVPIALATDCNPGSSPVISPTLVMNMSAIFFRMTPEEALAGFTRNAARALGLSHEIGTLEVGKQADLAVWDIDHPAELTNSIGNASLYKRYFNGTETPFN
ncbi:imidazolonepropionase [Sneathiella chinensis]|uniref:Imidazolonepropionase n=1 Tax=Sneathiella chinensis TaxID=349750 RepID=A0ABQ5U4D5_9PROT|nr:imidazolonepropionase [Sneathiella chinensis]GLQ06601.1 imidazolonepropionase [Sneathiella chinensis]